MVFWSWYSRSTPTIASSCRDRISFPAASYMSVIEKLDFLLTGMSRNMDILKNNIRALHQKLINNICDRFFESTADYQFGIQIRPESRCGGPQYGQYHWNGFNAWLFEYSGSDINRYRAVKKLSEWFSLSMPSSRAILACAFKCLYSPCTGIAYLGCSNVYKSLISSRWYSDRGTRARLLQ